MTTPKAFAEIRAKQKADAEQAERQRKETLEWRAKQVEADYEYAKKVLAPYHKVELDGHATKLKYSDKDHKITFLVDGKPYLVFKIIEGMKHCNCCDPCNCLSEWYRATEIRTTDKENEYYGYCWAFNKINFSRRVEENELATAFAKVMDEYPKWLNEQKKQ